MEICISFCPETLNITREDLIAFLSDVTNEEATFESMSDEELVAVLNKYPYSLLDFDIVATPSSVELCND